MQASKMLNDNRTVLFKKTRFINEKPYVLEISFDNKDVFIAAYDLESPENYLAQYNHQTFENFFLACDQDYEQVVNNLIIRRNELKVNPKLKPPKKPFTRENGVLTALSKKMPT